MKRHRDKGNTMARNVFISFRYTDGIDYKRELASLFNAYYDTVDFSENQNRSTMSDETIRRYLYRKLQRSSVTIVILSPLAINHEHNRQGEYDDWIYDEIRYSLENRINNRTNGLIAVYTPEAANLLISANNDGFMTIKDVDNLFRRNMMNVKLKYKTYPTPGIFDRDYDSYCSLISWKDFVGDVGKFVDIAASKRNALYKYDIVRRL